ncbi:MAG: OmpL47-type beta-barrel domain-containing protein [Candidatus Aquicultor sp.]
MHDHYKPDILPKSWFSPEYTINKYKQRGYSWVFVTEHDSLDPDLTDGSTEASWEAHYPHSRHIGVTGAKTSLATDPSFTNKYGSLSHMLGAIRDNFGYVVANHPNQTIPANYSWSLKDLNELEDAESVEIYNASVPDIRDLAGNKYGTSQWDDLLDRGKHIWGIAGDDFTPLPGIDYGFDGGTIRVFAQALSKDGILSAIRTGKFYATQGSHGPRFSGIEVNDVNISISTPEPADIRLVALTGKVIKEYPSSKVAIYRFRGDEGYIRVELVRDLDGAKAWSNPIFIGRQASTSAHFSEVTSASQSGFSYSSASLFNASMVAASVDTPTTIAFERAVLSIPPQTSEGSATIELVAPDKMPTDSPSWGYLSDLYNVASSVSQFMPGATLAISYADRNYAAFGEDYVTLFMFDGSTQEWVALPTTVNKQTKQASAQILEPGLYALSANFNDDTIKPTVTINSPSSSATLSGICTVTADFADDHGVYKAKIYLDDVLLKEDKSITNNIQGNVDFSKFSKGDHILKVDAEDVSGNIGEASVPVHVLSDVSQITINITSPLTSQLAETSITVAGTVSGAATEAYVIVDGRPFKVIPVGSTGAFTYTLDTSGLNGGEHSVSVSAFDAVGNAGTSSVPITVVPDTEAPETTIIEHPESVVRDGNVSFAFTSSDNRTKPTDMVYMYKLEDVDSTYTVAATTTVAYKDLPAGNYVFRVKAVDWIGNVDPMDATFSFTVNSNPTSTITIEPSSPDGDNGWYITKPVITLTADVLSTIFYSFDSGDEKVYADPIIALEGTHALSYYAADKLGKEEPHSQIFKVDTIAPTTPVLWSIGYITPSNVESIAIGGLSEQGSTIFITASDGEHEVRASVKAGGTFNAILNLASLGDGIVTFTAFAKDEAGNVSPLSIPVQTTKDISPPNTIVRTHGKLGDNGWFVGDIGVNLTAEDGVDGSGVARIEYSYDAENWQTYAIPFEISDEGTTTLYYRAIDNMGNTEIAKEEIVRLDKTPPMLTGAVTTLLNVNNWYNSDVTVHFDASDSVSGVHTYTPDTMISAEGINQLVMGTAIDQAGNEATYSVDGINIDKTAPLIAVAAPEEGSIYMLNQLVLANWNALDLLSGNEYAYGTIESGLPIDTLSVGPKTFIIEAEDKAGNRISKKVDYQVCYDYRGLLSPFKDGDDSFKLGSNVPVKFKLKDANGNYVENAIVRLFVAKIIDGVPGTEVPAMPTSSSETNEFKYDEVANQYIFNLKTKSLSVGHWRLRIELNDGSSKYADITLR